MHAIRINEKGGLEFERDYGGVFGKVWRKETEEM